jgi:GT2 family glycosyltransferase
MFGGFGDLPRRLGQPEKPALGVVQSAGSPVRMVTPPTLGPVTSKTASPAHIITPSTLGASNAPRWPGKGPQSRSAPGETIEMNIKPGSKILLSILIPTLTSRAAMLAQLVKKLEDQIFALGPEPEVQVLIFEDNRLHSVGAKRTRLLEEAEGEFVVFVDDDDEVSGDYVLDILRAIKQNPGVDCIGFRGVMTTNGQNQRQVIYSVRNREFTSVSGVYYRPPGHLTPIRRSIAVRYPYIDVNMGEDSEVAKRMIRDKALKTEYFIDRVLYHYKFRPAQSEAQNLSKRATKGIYSVVILSARPDNLRRCVTSIIENEPDLPRSRIIVVDDGARAGCEAEFPGITWLPGEKPFIFSRNANIGIRHAQGDVILLNDDTRLLTKFGFTSQSFAVRAEKNIGVCSSAIKGMVGNPRQQVGVVAAGLRAEATMLAFMAVYICKETQKKIGLLDELPDLPVAAMRVVLRRLDAELQRADALPFDALRSDLHAVDAQCRRHGAKSLHVGACVEVGGAAGRVVNDAVYTAASDINTKATSGSDFTEASRRAAIVAAFDAVKDQFAWDESNRRYVARTPIAP